MSVTSTVGPSIMVTMAVGSDGWRNGPVIVAHPSPWNPRPPWIVISRNPPGVRLRMYNIGILVTASMMMGVIIVSVSVTTEEQSN